MKIHGYQPTPEPDPIRRTERSGEAAGGEQTAAAKADRVALSKDAQILADAMKAAGQSPDIRPDVVERMKKMLESGELGKDSHKLAESIIDHLMEEK